jgi:hypothetical protein
MTSKIHRPHRRETRINLCAIATISLLLGSCGGGSGTAPQSIAQTHCNQTGVVSPSAVGEEQLAAAASTNFARCLKAPGANVEVGTASCPSPVVVQSSATAGTITVDAGATLSFADTTLTLNTAGVVVNGAVEACYIGQNTRTSQVTINFTGGQLTGHSEGITVNSGGTLALEGVKGAVPFGGTSWTVLSCPAGPTTFGPGNGVASPVLGANGACPGGPLTLQVAASVATDWQPGDWIVVGTTDFVPQNSEFVQIATLAATATGTTITLNSNTPLTQYHFGGAQPDPGAEGMTDDYTKNYGIDERAEVGLITRNVKLTSTVTTSALHWGGEIDLEPGSKARLTGVEIEKFGKPQLGSYPINLIGSASLDPPPGKQAPNIMDSDSIHHSYNHGIVLGSTATAGQGSGGASALNFANNVVARAVGSLYYLADGNEVQNQFTNNLGLGAMSNAFAIPSSPDTLASGYTAASAAMQFFWVGDYLTNNPANPPCSTTGGESPCYNGYDGFNIPNTDAINSNAWASGFWITNVLNTFTGNSIGGCQGQGRGFWYLPINTGTCGTQDIAEANTPLLAEGLGVSDAGLFADNRAHACYTGLDTAPDIGTNGATISSCPLQPQYSNEDVYTEIEGMTATRNRNRGIWVRPKWYVLDSARVATNRDNISVVSSGGTEGSPPGEWSVVSNSILAGISANNPGRFGPCPYVNEGAIVGNPGNYGCLDEDEVNSPGAGHGYPFANWNLEGEMLYDGPARLSGNEFVNFLVNPANYLTAPDQSYLAYYESNQPPNVYEGDAAFGWFQSNVNSYPPTQYSENATFTNTNLRHQVYTAGVNLSTFSDGDKNTVLLDESGETLAGYEVVPAGCTAPCTAVSGKSPVSFNNLPFVSTPNAVDECLAEGGQDTVLENRPTALMSPQDYATLEFSMQTPSTTNVNNLTFAKDQLDFAGMAGQQSDNGKLCPSTHSCINLLGRNQEGVYEPKVINGAAYTVMSTGVGIQQYTDVAFTDATVAGGISTTNPFQIRLSICYKSAKSQPVADGFTVTAGVKSLGQITSSGSAADLTPYFNMLLCNGLDNVNANYVQDCFGLPTPPGPPQPANVALTQLDASNSNPLATDLGMLQPGQYYYNTTTGFLTFLMEQTSPNGAMPTVALPLGGGPSPLGSCTGSSSDPCPDAAGGETFYSCPEGGCGLYTIAVTDSNYKPGVSTCMPYGTMGQDYTAPWPSNLNQLAYTDGTPITTTTIASNVVNKVNFPHITDKNPTMACPASSSAALAKPPWIGSTNPAPSPDLTFTLGLPAKVCIVGVTGGATVLPSTNLIPLTSQQTYTFMACDGTNQCSQPITVTGTQQSDATFTAGTGSCGIVSGKGTIPFIASFAPGTKCTCPS